MDDRQRFSQNRDGELSGLAAQEPFPVLEPLHVLAKQARDVKLGAVRQQRRAGTDRAAPPNLFSAVTRRLQVSDDASPVPGKSKAGASGRYGPDHAGKERSLSLEFVLSPLVIGVEECKVLAARRSDSRITRRCRSTALAMAYHANLRVFGRPQPLAGTVRRAVIHDYDLCRRLCLFEDAVQCPGEEISAVKRRNDNRDSP